MLQELGNILLFVLNPFILVILFGWAIAWYAFRKGEKLMGAAILFVWLTLVLRIHLPFMVYGWIFGERHLQQFGILGKMFIGAGEVMSASMVLFVPILIAYIPYALWKKQFGHVAVAFLLLFPAHLSYLESYFIFYPLVDTTKSEQFTLKQFDKIRPGMTREDVRGLIGDPIENAGQYNAPCEGQTGDNGAPRPYDFAWLNSSVCYDESDRVVETKKLWVPD